MKRHEKIKFVLRRLGISQALVAEKLGISRISISRYLNGHTDLASEKVFKILALLDIHTDDDLQKAVIKVERMVVPRARLEGRA
jgi:transcriptional regulator with XRE-family HTH domain